MLNSINENSTVGKISKGHGCISVTLRDKIAAGVTEQWLFLLLDQLFGD